MHFWWGGVASINFVVPNIAYAYTEEYANPVVEYKYELAQKPFSVAFTATDENAGDHGVSEVWMSDADKQTLLDHNLELVVEHDEDEEKYDIAIQSKKNPSSQQTLLPKGEGSFLVRLFLVDGFGNPSCYRFVFTHKPIPKKPVEHVYILNTMYRLYNPYTGEHLFTTDYKEVEALTPLGWNYEGAIGKVALHGEKGGVYRLYNPYTGEHHFTMSEDEVKACVAQGWRNEGIKFFSVSDPNAVLKGMVSMYNPYEKAFYHHYTSDAQEITTMQNAGWKREDIKWYVM